MLFALFTVVCYRPCRILVSNSELFVTDLVVYCLSNIELFVTDPVVYWCLTVSCLLQTLSYTGV